MLRKQIPFIKIFYKFKGAPSEWRTIWYILFGSNLFCAAFFILFASGKQQKWADAAELSRSETRTEDCQTD
uniref:Uncharacterized protein n=1 Tax=Meloidogyne enterolobii TaxID=390850 RepID=A0A6V7WH25_MELEN|nr:unnamed protein product [Meloidogyne enterolobii]